jgi:hypothetical protein
VRDVLGSGEILPVEGSIIDLTDPRLRDWWEIRERLGWVSIGPDPEEAARREREARDAFARTGESIRAAAAASVQSLDAGPAQVDDPVSTAPAVPARPPIPRSRELGRMRVADLRTLAAAYGLAPGERRSDLIAALLAIAETSP